MASELLTKSYLAGRVVVRKMKHVSGEVAIFFYDPALPPIYLNTFEPACLTDRPNVTVRTLMRSTLDDLVKRHYVAVVPQG